MGKGIKKTKDKKKIKDGRKKDIWEKKRREKVRASRRKINGVGEVEGNWSTNLNLESFHHIFFSGFFLNLSHLGCPIKKIVLKISKVTHIMPKRFHDYLTRLWKKFKVGQTDYWHSYIYIYIHIYSVHMRVCRQFKCRRASQLHNSRIYELLDSFILVNSHLSILLMITIPSLSILDHCPPHTQNSLKNNGMIKNLVSFAQNIWLWNNSNFV